MDNTKVVQDIIDKQSDDSIDYADKLLCDDCNEIFYMSIDKEDMLCPNCKSSNWRHVWDIEEEEDNYEEDFKDF